MNAKESQQGNEVLLSYVGMDIGYNQGKLMYLGGLEDAALGNIGTVNSPVQAQGVTIPPAIPDPVLFSYTFANGTDPISRVLLVNIISKGGQPSTCTFNVLVPSAGGAWVTKSANFTLNYGGNVVAFNPHGLAEWGDLVYLVDYESQQILIVEKKALDSVSGTVLTLSFQPFDLSGTLRDTDAKGQAIIALNGKLFALYLSTNAGATAYKDSQLVRMSITSSPPLIVDTKTVVGLNAQAIIPVDDGNAVQLLIPAIGGPQNLSGQTNQTASDIRYVPALAASWSDPAPAKVTGDATATPLLSYDIHAVAAAMRDGDSALYILTQIYDNSSSTALWRIYRTSVGEFLRIKDGTPLSQARALTVVDQGTVTSDSSWGVPFGIYQWDMLYEQVPDNQDDEGDRLWVAMGTPILVTGGAYENMIGDPAYGSPTGVFQNVYIQYGFIGGDNVNMGAFDLTIETLHQAKRGVSLKRSLRKSLVAPRPTEEAIAAAKAKSAQAKGGKTK
jgi:hypothetical protein